MIRVIISGAGLSGLSLAIALKKRGLDALVVEKRSRADFSEGLFLTLPENALRALNRMECLSGVLRKSAFATPRMRFLGTNGRTLGTVSNGWFDDRYPSITIFHRDLREALDEEASQLGIERIYNSGLESFEQTDGTVGVSLGDGRELTCDLLVGADGVWSRTREQFGGDACRPENSSLINVGGELDASWIESTPGEIRMLWGRQAFFGYHTHRSGRTIWFANIPASESLPNGSIDTQSDRSFRKTIAQYFADDIELPTRFIFSSEYIRTYQIVDFKPQSTWHQGNVVLIGDAAHAVAPSTGQGAALAFEDAVFLSHCLVRAQSIRQALSDFESHRMPRTEKVYRLGKQWSSTKTQQTRFAVWMRERTMPWVLRFTANESKLRWLHAYDAAQSYLTDLRARGPV